ncbi:MAG: TRAP transporter large permease subunit [Gammaproteobacteria bacterium]|nr:TRAP transporter large permease subunit [Gammaproteobacteria bacterium]
MLGLESLGIEWASYLLVIMILLLLLTGLPLAFVTGLTAMFFAFGWFNPMVATHVVTSRVYGFLNEYVLVAIPMFVLMASILDRSGIARDLYNTMRLFAGRLPGGVSIQTIIVALFLAAMSGIIGGEIVLLGLLALPQMLRLGYDRGLAIGTVCAGGSLGTMVPPSIVLIVYGMTANVSIGDLFVATIFPALILGGFYITYIVTRCVLNPSLAPRLPDTELNIPLSEKLKSAKSVILPVGVAAMVLGSIYGGIASVTEAASMGVVGVLLSTWVRKELSWHMLYKSVRQTLNTCGMIIWIGIGANALVGVYNLMGGNSFVESAILGLDVAPIVVILVMMLILLVLGLFMDWIGIALLAMPIFVPIVIKLGFDPIWFGILFSMNMQVSYISPPFGPAAFYLKSVAPPDITLGVIFKSLWPFIILQLIAIMLVLSFPSIALWLPGLS